MASEDLPAPGVGESIGRRGEEIAKAQQGPGRAEAGTDDSGRPTAKATQRLHTGIDPQEPVDDQSPNLPAS